MKRAIVDKLHVIVLGAKPPTAAEWAAYLDTLEKQGPGLVELIVTAGAGPTRSQRTALRSYLAGRKLPAAILVDGSRWTKLKIDFWGRVTRSWEVRVFSSRALFDALAFLGVLASRAEVIRREIDRLQREEGEARPQIELGEALRRIEASYKIPKDAEERILKVVLER